MINQTGGRVERFRPSTLSQCVERGALTHGALSAERAPQALHGAPRLQLGLLQGVRVWLGGLGRAGRPVRTRLDRGEDRGRERDTEETGRREENVEEGKWGLCGKGEKMKG